MNKNLIFLSALFVLLGVLSGCDVRVKGQVPPPSRIYTQLLNEIDGPYIYDKKDSVTVITVEKDWDLSFFIEKQTVKRMEGQRFSCHVNNTDRDSFSFSLRRPYKIPPARYEAPERIFVTSDIEGNFNAFYSMLTGNGIMDRDYNWTFGTGHLVVAGDMVDRGNNAWPCLWLLYKLEQDAEKAGGQVHYILGNHDVMNMHANVKYVKRRYIELAKIVSGKEDEKEAYRYLLSSTNEIAKWIASKNTVEKIGDALYVHGGISTEVVDAGLSIEEINAIVRKNIRRDLTNDPGDDEVENMVFGRLGPLWYRGLVKDYKEHYEKTTSNELHQILDFFGVKRIVVGHTIVDEQVTSDFEGRVIRVDIKHPHEKFTGKSQGLLIESGQYYKVNDHGEKYRLSMTTVH